MADQDEQDSGRKLTPLQIQEDLLRQALSLKGSIDGLLRQIEIAQPLPPYSAMFARLSTLREAVDRFTTEAHRHKDLLTTTVIVPTGQFPGKYHEEMIRTLLRTKMEPHVEDWEYQHLTAARDRENKLDIEKRRGNMTSLTENDRAELWDWAAEAAQNILQNHVWFEADYTMAEKENGIENVNHGLRRKLTIPELGEDEFGDDDDEDELFDDVEDDKADDMDMDSSELESDKSNLAMPAVTKKPLAMDKVHRYMMRGEAV